jgi:hypothetical protein
VSVELHGDSAPRGGGWLPSRAFDPPPEQTERPQMRTIPHPSTSTVGQLRYIQRGKSKGGRVGGGFIWGIIGCIHITT